MIDRRAQIFFSMNQSLDLSSNRRDQSRAMDNDAFSHMSVYPSICLSVCLLSSITFPTVINEEYSLPTVRALSKQTMEQRQSCYFSRPLICNENKYVQSSPLLHLQIRRLSCSSIMSVHSTISSRDQMIEDLSIVLLTFNHITDVRTPIEKKAFSNVAVVVVMHSRNRISISSE